MNPRSGQLRRGYRRGAEACRAVLLAAPILLAAPNPCPAVLRPLDCAIL